MIQEMSEETTQFIEPKVSGTKDFLKSLVALIFLIAQIVVSVWGFAMLGTYGKNWYAILYLLVPIVFGALGILLLSKLDKRFLD